MLIPETRPPTMNMQFFSLKHLASLVILGRKRAHTVHARVAEITGIAKCFFVETAMIKRSPLVGCRGGA